MPAGSDRSAGANATRCGGCMWITPLALWPGPVHQRVHGHDLGAHPVQVAFGYAPVEADHGEVIGHEIACPACSRPIATSTTARWSAKCDRPAASATEATGACPGVVISASL
jgi:hypothetical protein